MKTVKIMGTPAIMLSLILLVFSVKPAVGAWVDEGLYMKTTDQGVVVDSTVKAYLNLDRGTKSESAWLGFKSAGAYNWLIGTGRTGYNSDLSFCSYAYNTWSTPLYLEYATGYVGIGTTTPEVPLHVVGGTDASLGGGGYIITGETTGSNIVIDNNEIMARSAGDASNLHLNLNGGFVGIGTTPIYTLDVMADDPGYWATCIFNDGNNANRKGLRILCGTNDNSNINNMITFGDGDGTPVGSITSSGGTVSYNSFTADHLASLPEEKNKEDLLYGTVVCLRATRPDPERPRQVDYEVEPSKKAYDQSVFGVYSGKHVDEENLHSIYALGDGHILVTREGGDIEIGDYLTTSSKEGHAMRQNDHMLCNYTVAKSQENVIWEKEKTDTKLIPCTYHAQ